MSSNSEFVLRWSVPKHRMVEGMSSPPLRIGAFDWKAELRALGDDPLSAITYQFIIECASTTKASQWSAETHIDYTLRDGTMTVWTQQQAKRKFDNDMSARLLIGVREREKVIGANQHGLFVVTYPSSTRNDDSTLTIEFCVKIIRSDVVQYVAPMIDLSKFLSPNEHGNVTLVLGNVKLKVSRERLAYHSPVFNALFYRDFAEKSKEEIELKDVDYKEFLDVISLIFTLCPKIPDAAIFHILPIADRFQMMYVFNFAEEYLIESSNVSFAEKLLLADMYRLGTLKEFCMHKDRTEDLKAIMDTQEYAQLSANLREEIAQNLNSV